MTREIIRNNRRLTAGVNEAAEDGRNTSSLDSWK